MPFVRFFPVICNIVKCFKVFTPDSFCLAYIDYTRVGEVAAYTRRSV